METSPEKVFVLENGKYAELSYSEFCYRNELVKTYSSKYFIPVHGMLMEVSEDVYREFYKTKRRQKYLEERSAKNGEFSYDMLTTESFHGEDILCCETADAGEIAVRRIMLDRLRQALLLLTEDEQRLVLEIFGEEQSERALAKKYGISQAAIHKRKDRILKKLRKWI